MAIVTSVAADLLDEHLLGLVERVDVGVVAVAVVGELLERASLRLPMPKPSTVRNTPLLAFSSIRRIRSPSSVTPTLKSPSVREDDAVDAALDEVGARRS